MFGFKRRPTGRDLVDGMHERLVAASRDPRLYEGGGLPDSMEGRFEALVVHVVLVLRRLRQLPAPASDVAQDLVDTVFAHLEIALREMGVGDFGVPKRMKKLAQAFYDRSAGYDRILDSGGEVLPEMAVRLGVSELPARLARYFRDSEARLLGTSIDGMLSGPPFAEPETVR